MCELSYLFLSFASVRMAELPSPSFNLAPLLTRHQCMTANSNLSMTIKSEFNSTLSFASTIHEILFPLLTRPFINSWSFSHLSPSTSCFYAIPALEPQQLFSDLHPMAHSPCRLCIKRAVGTKGGTDSGPTTLSCITSQHHHIFPLCRACLKLHKVVLFLQTIKCVFRGEIILSRIPADNRNVAGCELKNLFAEDYCAALTTPQSSFSKQH